eukprot:SAG31_NODE_29774_length_390_cov_0.704467_1_plen_124_part_10
MSAGARAAAVMAALTVGIAPFNEPVVQQSLPETIDGDSIRFTNVTHSSATVHWQAPGLGRWQWPILGYRIQITSSSGWTLVPGVTTPGDTTPESYANTGLDFTVCPEAMETLGTCSGGFLTAEY